MQYVKAGQSTLTVFHFLRNTKVGDLHATLVVNKDIRALNVAMDNIPFVEVVKAAEDLSHEVLYERLLESTVVAQQRRHATTRHVLQENVQVVVIE